MKLKIRRYKNKSDLFFTVSDRDYSKVRNLFWHLNSGGYVISKVNGKEVYLHRFILDFPSAVVDHIDGNKLNNKRSNLRVCSIKENIRNSKSRINNKTGKVGVSFRKDRNKYRAYIVVDREQISLGHFQIIDDAINARIKAEKNFFGKFAPQ